MRCAIVRDHDFEIVADNLVERRCRFRHPLYRLSLLDDSGCRVRICYKKHEEYNMLTATKDSSTLDWQDASRLFRSFGSLSWLLQLSPFNGSSGATLSHSHTRLASSSAHLTTLALWMCLLSPLSAAQEFLISCMQCTRACLQPLRESTSHYRLDAYQS